MILTNPRLVAFAASVLAVGLFVPFANGLARQKSDRDDSKKSAEVKPGDSSRDEDQAKEKDASRIEKLGAEADELTAKIELLQFEIEALRQQVQGGYPLPTPEFGMGMMGGGMGMMGGRAMLGGMPPQKPAGAEDKSPRDAETEGDKQKPKENPQEKIADEMMNHRRKYYETLKKEFLTKSVQLGAMRRRLATVHARLAKLEGETPKPQALGSNGSDKRFERRLDAIERKVNEILKKIDPENR